MDLPAINLKSFPHDQGITGTVRTGVSEIHPQQNDPEFLIDSSDACGDGRMSDDSLRLHILGCRIRGRRPRRLSADFKAVSIRSEGSINCDEAPDLQPRRIELRDLDRVFPRIALGRLRYNRHGLIRRLQCIYREDGALSLIASDLRLDFGDLFVGDFQPYDD